MAIHWESSKRPLYVRTIWKDGQHHVILDKNNDKILETHLQPSSYRRNKPCFFNQHRITKSAGSTTLNLSIPSVRFKLASVKKFRNYKKPELERPKTCPKGNRDIISYKDLNDEVQFEQELFYSEPLKVQKFRKTVNISENRIKNFLDTPVILDNALSEKVITWLELESNNSKDSKKSVKKIFNNSTKPCKENSKKSTKEIDYLCNTTENILASSVLKNAAECKKKEHANIVIFNEEEKISGTDEDHFYHLLTPRTVHDELAYKDEYNLDGREINNNKISNVKRELHIFMPNLPRKLSDCESSIISSKLSAY